MNLYLRGELSSQMQCGPEVVYCHFGETYYLIFDMFADCGNC